jgi:hypothetical protein
MIYIPSTTLALIIDLVVYLITLSVTRLCIVLSCGDSKWWIWKDAESKGNSTNLEFAWKE